jgi:hypothetical protein
MDESASDLPKPYEKWSGRATKVPTIARIMKKGIEAFWRSPGCPLSHQMKSISPPIVDMAIIMKNFHNAQP